MGVTYAVTSASDCFSYMYSFLSSCGITYITDTPNLKVFRDFSNSVYLQMYLDTNNDRVIIFPSVDYNASSSDWFVQTKSPMYGSSYLGMAIPYIEGGSLVCNYNDSSVLFSIIGTSVARETFLLGFGVMDKLYSYWEGGFYLLGNREVSIRDTINYLGNANDLKLLMRIDADFATANVRGNLYWAGNYVETRVWTTYEVWNVGDIVSYNGNIYVCTNAFIGDNTDFTDYYNSGYFTFLCLDTNINSLMAVQSIVGNGGDYKLPTYANFFMGEDLLWRGSTNQLNCIALCMPLYFYIIRDPQQLKQFSCVGKTDIINYVSMFDMSSGREIQSSYPVENDSFQCFTIGKRRNVGDDLKGGYVGVAFRQP